MPYTCIRKCFYENRLWEVGESYSPITKDEKVPKHFVKDEEQKLEKAIKGRKEAEKHPSGPNTLSQMAATPRAKPGDPIPAAAVSPEAAAKELMAELGGEFSLND